MKKNISVIILFSIFYFLFSHRVHAAILYSAAANQDTYVGQSFVVDWYLDTEGKSINSIDLKLNYSKDTLDVAETTAGNSLISLWLKYPKAENGSIELTGGIPNGANDSKLSIFRITFEAKASGSAFVRLDPSSQILLNDGTGSSELLKFKNLEFNVYPKDFKPIDITSPTNPDQNQWYSARDVSIRFNQKNGEEYSYSFSSNIEVIPADLAMQVPTEIKYSNLVDGVYYFKLNSKIGPTSWKEAGVYRIQIDSTAPEEFTPIIGQDPSIFDGKKFLSFSTVDKISGISHYYIKVGLFGKTLETQSPYKLYKPLIGDSVEVSAIDEAGNIRSEIVPWSGIISVKWFEIILILIGLLALGYGFRNQIKKLNE